jgi:hypothetical protein
MNAKEITPRMIVNVPATAIFGGTFSGFDLCISTNTPPSYIKNMPPMIRQIIDARFRIASIDDICLLIMHKDFRIGFVAFKALGPLRKSYIICISSEY